MDTEKAFLKSRGDLIKMEVELLYRIQTSPLAMKLKGADVVKVFICSFQWNCFICIPIDLSGIHNNAWARGLDFLLIINIGRNEVSSMNLPQTDFPLFISNCDCS